MPAPFFLEGPGKSEIDAAILLARQWAVLMGDPPALVDNDDYSSKQWATWSQEAAVDAQDARAAAEAALASAQALVVSTPYVVSMTGITGIPLVNDAEAFFILDPCTAVLFHVGLLNAQASGAAFTVICQRNNVTIASVVMVNGANTGEAVIEVACVKNDVIKYQVTQVGTGATGLRCSLKTTAPVV
jgi:hypothetical protein